MPSSNADIGQTIAAILQLKSAGKGAIVGRILTEAMPNGATLDHAAHRLASPPAANGAATVIDYQEVGGMRYLDAAGFPGRTVGLRPEAP